MYQQLHNALAQARIVDLHHAAATARRQRRDHGQPARDWSPQIALLAAWSTRWHDDCARDLLHVDVADSPTRPPAR